MNNIFKKLNMGHYVTLLFFICIAVFSFSFMKNNVLYLDDIMIDFMRDGIKFHIPLIGYGTWTLQFQNQLLCYLPNKLGVNIQDWALVFGGVFKAVVITAISYVFYKFIRTEKTPLIIALPLTFIFYSLFVILITNLTINNFVIYVGFFRFTFCALLMSVFLYLYYNFCINNNVNLWIILPFAVVTAASSEVVACSLLTIVFLTAISKIIYGKISLENFDKKKFFTDLLIFTALVTGVVLLVSDEGFRCHVLTKKNSELTCFQDYLLILPEFLKQYFKNVLFIHSFPLCVLFLSYMSAFITNKSDKNYLLKKIIFSVNCLLSVLVLYFSLIIVGKFDATNDYWINHPDLYAFVIPLFFISLIIPLTNIIQGIYSSQKRLLFITAFLCAGILFPQLTNTANYLNNEYKIYKEMTYIRDKAIAFCMYSNIHLPDSDIFKYLFIDKNIYSESIENYEMPVTKLDVDDFEKSFKVILLEDYMPAVYNIKKDNPKVINGITTLQQTMSYLFNQGFRYDEVDKNEYKFSDISNRNFVLGTEIN